MEIKMSPQRPYLLRALFDWLLDNDCTPHVVVDATQPYVEVPEEHVQNGQIVLNVHPEAVVRFNMDLEHISFEARFSGVAQRIWLPMAAIVAIYGRENGAGTIFEAEEAYAEAAPLDPAGQRQQGGMQVVSSNDTKDDTQGTPEQDELSNSRSEKPPETKPKSRPSLKVVK